jgi:hypothetical protein
LALIVRIQPRAVREIQAAAEWWSVNRAAAPGAIRVDLQAALEAVRGEHLEVLAFWHASRGQEPIV